MQPSWGARIVRGLVGLVLTAMGLVFVASTLLAALLVLCLGSLRALWGRLTGRPLTPWAFRMNPRKGWQTWEDLRRRHGAPSAAGDPAAQARPRPRLGRAGEVSDVQARERP